MDRIPYFPIYVGDYLQEPQATCSLAAQGLYFRLKMIAHISERYGYLYENGRPISDERLAQRCYLTIEQYIVVLTELRQVGVPSITADGIYFFPEMIEQHRKRAEKRKSKRKERKRKNVAHDTQATSLRPLETESENKDVVVSVVGDGAEEPKPYRVPQDPAGKVILAYKLLTGAEKEDRGWDSRNWARCAKSAPQLLLIFKGDWKKTVEYMQAFKAHCEKSKLDWTMETMVKKYDDWRGKHGF